MDLAQKPVYKLDLAAGTSVVNLTTPLVEGDDRAQTFTLELTDKGAPANLNGHSVTAYFGRGKTVEAEADTIPVPGTVSGNVATITLTESCYSRSCYFSMPIRLSNGATGQKRTYLIVRGTVVKSVDGTIIDPDGSVPSLDDLFAQIAVMERSRQAAEEATEEALAAAARADEARESIQGDLATLTEDIARNTAPPIIPTVTGSIVTVTGGAARPAVEVISHIEPVQSGSGDPSPNNVRPISGWNSVNAWATGANLWDEQYEIGGFSDDTGIVTSQKDRIRSKNMISVKPLTGYYVAFTSSFGRLYFYDGSKNLLSSNAFTKGSFTTPPNCQYMKFYWVNSTYTAGDIMLNLGSSPVSYEPYCGQTLTSSLPETVYGGKRNWTKGVLTVARVKRKIKDLPWEKHSDTAGGSRYEAYITDKVTGEIGLLCDQLPVVLYRDESRPETIAERGNNKNIRIITAYSTQEEMLAAYGVVEVVYYLATPYTIQLTPQQLDTLKGTNNVWSDCGDTTLSYIADTELWATQKFSAIAAAMLAN